MIVSIFMIFQVILFFENGAKLFGFLYSDGRVGG
jgi:hypothetical protein